MRARSERPLRTCAAQPADRPGPLCTKCTPGTHAGPAFGPNPARHGPVCEVYTRYVYRSRLRRRRPLSRFPEPPPTPPAPTEEELALEYRENNVRYLEMLRRTARAGESLDR